MLLTYREVCEWAKWRFGEDLWRREHEDRIREIGDQPFDYTKLQWLPGAEKTLQTLKDAGHRLCFLSSYDTGVFPERAKFLGLFRYFDPAYVRVVEFRKTVEDFKLVSGWNEDGPRHPEWKWFAVGNGESDIKPALEIADNWRGIYIPHGSTSKYFTEAKGPQRFMPPPFDHPRVYTIGAITKLLPLIRSLS